MLYIKAANTWGLALCGNGLGSHIWTQDDKTEKKKKKKGEETNEKKFDTPTFTPWGTF